MLVAFYFPWLTGAKTFYQSDLQYYFEPLCSYLGKSYAHGRVPLWNPYLFCGMSQVAVASPGALYPLNALFALSSFSQALAAYMILHQMIAAVGSYLLISRLGWGRLSAVVGGLGAALSGYMFSAIMNFTLMSTAAWIPLLFFLLEHIGHKYTRTNMRWVIAAAFCMGIFVVSGRPEIWVPGVGAVCYYLIVSTLYFHRNSDTWSDAIMLLCWRAAGCGLGLLMAAPMLLPVLEWLQISNRAFGMEPQYVFLWSANWYDWLGLALAQPLGDITILDAPYADFIRTRQGAIPFLPSCYLGPVLLTLAFFGLCDGKWKGKFCIVGAGIFAALLALGKYTAVAPLLLKAFPVIALFRYPVKLMILPVLCLCMMAARGAFVVSKKQISLLALVASFAIWAEVLITALSFVVSDDLHYLVRSVPVETASFSMAKLHQIQVLLGNGLTMVSLVGLGVVILAAVYRLGRLQGIAWATSIIAATVITLVQACWQYPTHTQDSSYYRQKSWLAEDLKKLTSNDARGAEFRFRILPLIFGPLACPDCARLKGLAQEKAYYQHSRFMLEENETLDFGIPSVQGYESAKTGPFDLYASAAIMSSRVWPYRQLDTLISDAPVWRLCKISSAAYVYTECGPGNVMLATVPQLDKRWFELIKEDLTSNVRIYRCRDVFPRAFFAPSVKWVNNWRGLRAELTSLNPAITLDTVYVKNNEPGEIPINNVPRQDIDRGIAFSEDEPEHVGLHVTCDNQRLLVLTDMHYSGWQAYIDGHKTPILKANGFFKAVVVPPGTHHIEFKFEPLSLYLGLAGAGGAVAMCGLLLAFSRRPACSVTPEPQEGLTEN